MFHDVAPRLYCSAHLFDNFFSRGSDQKSDAPVQGSLPSAPSSVLPSTLHSFVPFCITFGSWFNFTQGALPWKFNLKIISPGTILFFVPPFLGEHLFLLLIVYYLPPPLDRKIMSVFLPSVFSVPSTVPNTEYLLAQNEIRISARLQTKIHKHSWCSFILNTLY